ncbi:uncharacterized protein LOC132068503 isoform X1 [Lycium ferocissimum]|uniref:uncharacterized protein LOC132068503 isoform X1 n=1 Tax=Lycium ferocissimum TaxID=112874 RepID=UPI00281583C9|nr:uncharacterized protein LOC132068503 isoform X1 [Lycium ferocissimum]XP_059318091.1 uncharacterized protein LOC132068503 isoform X1 [Lycium ferocissimum]XP_059318092.1 uncharacterized protein LOC132068503 isoform X1 [Lycium ferocissimum]
MIVAFEKGKSLSLKEKQFLYDIVANGRNGIDVDKFDYSERDTRAYGLRHRDILSGRRNVSILEIIMLHETLTSFKYSQYEDSVQLEYLQNCGGFLVTTALAYGNENTPVN